MQRKMTIEIRNKTPAFNESFVSTIDLPTLPLALRDAEQRARLPRDPDPPPEIVVISCPDLPELIDCRLDSPSTEEMNFFASRMEQLTDTQMTAFRALCAVHFANDPTFEEPVPIWQLINMTYGLDDVIVVGGIESDEDIADFVIANGLNEDVAAVPESSLYLLDKKMIGKLQRQNDNGVILDGNYVVTEGYEIPEIYDGAVLPNRDRSLDLAVFRLLVSESPVNDSMQEFYLVDHGSEYSLCLLLGGTPTAGAEYGQYAFDHYAEAVGKPVEENGWLTYGDGYDWECVFKEAF